MMTVFFQQILNGVILGSLYMLVALGLSLIFGILEVVNFAHGEFYMVAAFLTLFIMVKLGAPFLVAMLAAMVVMAVFGVIVERVVFRPIVGKPMINGMLVSFGLSIFLMNLALLLFKADPRKIDSGLAHLTITFLGLRVTAERLLALILGVFLVALLSHFIQNTRTGKAMRAVAQDRIAAQLAGVNVFRIYAITFAVGSVLASAAGAMVGAIFLVAPDMGWTVVLKSFIVVILGGFGSIKGVVFASLIIGLVESLGGGYISYAYKDAYPFLLLVLAFLLRPEGLMGGSKS
ncbi:MAG TPA: branched-chain amino acid ABC transporter permease [Syntrophobacteria bacterium]|nr:branched-chain amino acid ABC transporter permease [Syntrophobacteria bacterium]